MSYCDILRPLECPICGRTHPLRKHGTYSRYFCDLVVGILQISILRYYCPGCHGTVSFLPSFAIPRRQYGAGIISICLQLIFACGVSFKGVSRVYPRVSRVLAGSWVKSWHYNTTGIISVMRNYFSICPQPADVCSYHNGKYITAESLEAFFIISDFVVGDDIYSCHGDCNSQVPSCSNRCCSGILKGIQERFSLLPLSVPLL